MSSCAPDSTALQQLIESRSEIGAPYVTSHDVTIAITSSNLAYRDRVTRLARVLLIGQKTELNLWDKNKWLAVL